MTNKRPMYDVSEDSPNFHEVTCRIGRAGRPVRASRSAVPQSRDFLRLSPVQRSLLCNLLPYRRLSGPKTPGASPGYNPIQVLHLKAPAALASSGFRVGGEQHERSKCWAREGECPGVKAERRQLGERWVLSATSVSTLYLIRSLF